MASVVEDIVEDFYLYFIIFHRWSVGTYNCQVVVASQWDP